ncbi:MAG: hypothetical protein AAGG47_18910 [Pseudomonadota bacterium]
MTDAQPLNALKWAEAFCYGVVVTLLVTSIYVREIADENEALLRSPSSGALQPADHANSQLYRSTRDLSYNLGLAQFGALSGAILLGWLRRRRERSNGATEARREMREAALGGADFDGLRRNHND